MSSPFTSKLGTNYCPQDEEIAQIQTLLVEPTLRLKRLDDEITVLQKALDKLAEERTGISAYVDAHKALISPVRRLPLDVIQEIFTACIPTHRNCVMSAVEAPVLLGRICSSWRYISLSTPRLWSRLHIVEPDFTNPPDLFEKKLAQRAETTKMWLGRSGNSALSISLQSNGINYLATSQNRLIPALLRFASRWEHISFRAPLSRLDIASHLAEVDVPMLKSFSIDDLFGQQDAIRWDSFGFLRAPKMSSFSSRGCSFNPIEIPLRWDGLINLSITTTWGAQCFLTSETARQMLSHCPQLQTCRLPVRDLPDIVSNGLDEPVLELSLLHTLDLDCDTFQTVCHLFSWASFPQLRNLKLHGISNNENMSYVRFLATAPLIEKLDITHGQFSKPFLASFLRELPSTLRELNISLQPGAGNPSFDDEILESFSPSVSFPNPCCPGLQALEIQYYCAISDKALLRFLKSRTLKRVVICFGRAMELDIRPELQPLVQNGLHLALTYPPVQSFSPWAGLPDAPNFFLAP
ncbi:hypothetical protein FB451DRAFT_1377179 [Mycena latifolia]|nr:hypothetical protein FB451DRAFT_1377179 [Mycena latifolia]